MLQPTLTRRVEDALRALDEAFPLFELLDSLDEVHALLDKYLLGIAVGTGGSIQENASAAHSQLASLSRLTKGVNARKLFRVLETLEIHLSASLAHGTDEPKHILDSISLIDEFADRYNSYVVHPIGENALPLVLSARQLKQSLSNLRSFLEHLRTNSSGLLAHAQYEAEFSLVLLHVTDLQDFAHRLATLSELYSELCYVLGVSVAERPLRIGKVESGSLWTRLFGDTRAVGLMLSLIESAVRFFHRNYTTEGKIAAIPKKIESLEAILQFSNRLKDSGVDVASLQSSIAKSAASITESLNALVSDQPVIELNGQVLSVGHEIQQKLLEQGKVARISYDEESTGAKPTPPSDGGSAA